LRFASLDHFGISFWKISLEGVAASGVMSSMAAVVTGDVLGEAKIPVLVVIAALVFYIVLSMPRRILDGQRVSQAREAVPLAAAATACLRVTGSRSRTMVLLRSRDPTLSRNIRDVGRLVLLGAGVDNAIRRASQSLSSYSVIAALRSVATLSSRTFDAGDEEARGLASSSELGRETKLPIFMTACFFTPIMLLLYAVFSHAYEPGSLIELLSLQFIVLDLAYYLSSSERGTQ
jgi:hypothetical protein